jgi:hypothetical protein
MIRYYMPEASEDDAGGNGVFGTGTSLPQPARGPEASEDDAGGNAVCGTSCIVDAGGNGVCGTSCIVGACIQSEEIECPDVS